MRCLSPIQWPIVKALALCSRLVVVQLDGFGCLQVCRFGRVVSTGDSS